MKARDRIIGFIADGAKALSNDDLCLLLVYMVALIDHAEGTADTP